jgi:hypothetical protein
VDAKIKGMLYELWWSDKWRHLINPPHWLELEHFLVVVPKRYDNSQIISSIREARRNLKVIRLREKEGGLTEAVIEVEKLEKMFPSDSRTAEHLVKLEILTTKLGKKS